MTFAMTSADLPKPTNPTYLAATLYNAKVEKIEFDPANPEHRAAYVEFKRTGKWSIKFATKWPKSIINTVEEQLAIYACSSECKN